MEFLVFYVFASMALFSAFIVITAKNPVHSVLFLVLVFCNATGILLLVDAEFMALIFLVVYVGAIAVLFLFVVMMLDIVPEETQVNQNIKENAVFNVKYLLNEQVKIQSPANLRFFPMVLVLFFIFMGEIYFIQDSAANQPKEINGQTLFVHWVEYLDGVGSSASNLETLGQVLYTYYCYFFLIAGLVLLVSIVGAIIITLQSKQSQLFKPSNKENKLDDTFGGDQVKRQQISQQISRDANIAIFLVK